MKKINKTFAVVLSVCLLLTFAPLSALADPAVVAEGNLTDTVTWRVTDDGVLTIGGSGDMPNYNGHTAYLRKYLSHKDEITGVVIEDGITSVGAWSFYNFTNLTGALTIPDSVTSIGEYAFYNCAGLNGTLTLDSGNAQLQEIGGCAFESCCFTGSLVIPDSVRSIGYYAFEYCPFNGMLTLGTASSQLQSIGDSAFSGCKKFTGNLVIPDSVTSIGQLAFYACSGFNGTLTLGTANSRLQTIGNNAFYQCSNFTGNLVVPDSVTSIGAHAFDRCTGFNGTLILGTNNSRLQTIGSDAFFQCRGFTGDLVIPDSVVTIGPSAFARCDGLNGTLTLGTENSHLQTIDASAFQYCSNLTGNIVIPDSVTSIIGNAFDSCFGFNGTLTLGSQLQIIDRYTFCSCTGLTGDLVIPDSVTEIGESAFSGCGFNGTLTLGSEESHLQSIGNQAFWTCSGFTGDLVLPDTVTNVDAYAFYSCTGFNGALTIGDAVETIGNKAFMGCTNLTGKLTIKNPETVFGTCALHGCAKDTDILTFFADHPEFIEVIQTAYTAPTITSDGSVSYKVNCTDPGHTTDAQKYITSVTKTIPYIFIDAITPDPAEVSLWPGETVQIGTTVAPDDAMDPNVTFTSDDTGVVTVDDAGLLTAVAPGTATITIVPADTSDSAIATVSVTVKQHVTSITATAEKTLLDMEDAPYTQITVEVIPDDADNKNVIYTSSDPTVLDVDADGLVIALHQGTATVTVAAADGYGAETTIDFTVTHDLYALRVGPTVEEEETGEATVETNTARTFTVQYASSDPDVLEIAPETGAFTAKKKGTVTVTAELDFEDGGHKTLSQDVVVRDPHEGEFRCSRCDWYDEVKDAPGIRGIVYWMIHTITHFVQLINSMT